MSRIGQAGYALPQLVVEGYGEAFVYNKNDYFNEFQEVIRDKNEFIECTLLTPQGYYIPKILLGISQHTTRVDWVSFFLLLIIMFVNPTAAISVAVIIVAGP